MEDTRDLLHQAELRQTDLEAQNEELRSALELLEASREYYFDLYELAPVGYLRLNRSGMILQANAAAAELLGLDRVASKPQWLYQLIVKSQLSDFGLMLSRLWRTRQAQSSEMQLLTLNAKPLWVNLSMEAHTRAGSSFLHVVLIDITQRMQAQAALLENQERFRTLTESTPEAIMVHRDGVILYANAAARLMSGATAPLRDLVGTHIMERVHPDFRQPLAQRLADFGPQNRGRTVPIQVTLLQLDGASIEAEISGHWITYGDSPAVQVAIRDVTEQRRQEQGLRIAAAAFECQECMLVLDAEGKILRVNRAFSLITGYAEHEVVGRSSALLRSVQHPISLYEAIWSEIHRTGCWMGQVWHRHKDGSPYLALGGTTAVRDAQAQVSHYVINFIDATHRQQQEQERLADEAAHRETLVREVHHRIKNHLQGVMSLLRRFATKHPETAQPLRDAIAQVHSISVIHGLTAHERLTRISVAELTGAVAREIQNLWQTPITLDPCDQAARWNLHEDDAVPIALVLNELISNAVKHGGQASGGVRVTLNQGSSPEGLNIRISNTGQFSRAAAGPGHSGLQLIAALMPRHGAQLKREQQGETVVTLLELKPPVVFIGLDPPNTGCGALDLDLVLD